MGIELGTFSVVGTLWNFRKVHPHGPKSTRVRPLVQPLYCHHCSNFPCKMFWLAMYSKHGQIELWFLLSVPEWYLLTAYWLKFWLPATIRSGQKVPGRWKLENGAPPKSDPAQFFWGDFRAWSTSRVTLVHCIFSFSKFGRVRLLGHYFR